MRSGSDSDPKTEEKQLEAEGQGIGNDATQHKQHEYRVGVEEMLVWKSHLDQRHGGGNGEAKNAMVDHIHRDRVGLLCWKVVDQQLQLLMIHENIISISILL
ncbi:hypothetical protein L3X38_013339 [Prunus dulcis]|uniref:Uncharacterized protein n=1 Tax=Prunus dulcis TaxID=3755 RepID=A0AAD4WNB0_PRUDU|nr:hypothetical protein L3X38_013339 [Prunus dulcis]